jgi:hypothetical protein
MLIDCDTCTARGTGCTDCVVTVLLGAPPGWRGSDPVVVPMTARARPAGAAPGPALPSPVDDGPAEEVALDEVALEGVAEGPPTDPTRGGTVSAEDVVVPPAGVVVEFDEVERRAVRALSAAGLVPPLRHRTGADDRPGGGAGRGRRTG